MTNEQQADINMFNSLKAALASFSDIYDDDEAFKAAVTKFLAAHSANATAAANAHPDNSGYSKVKKTAKTKLSKTVANLCGRAFVTLKDQDEIEISDQMLVNPSNYSKESDSECARLAQAMHDIMGTYIGLLTGYVTAAKLTALQAEIDEFNGLQGTSEMVHEVSPMLTQKFVESFIPVKSRVEDIKLLLRDYETTNDEFFTAITAAMVVPAVAIRHTYVAITAIGKDSGRMLENIVFTLTEAKKSATTDWEGKALIEEVKSGKDVLTGVFNDKVVYTSHIVIVKAMTNNFHLKIDAM